MQVHLVTNSCAEFAAGTNFGLASSAFTSIGDAGGVTTAKAGMTRLNCNAGVTGLRRDGYVAAGYIQERNTWSPNLPMFWKFLFCAENTDHVFYVGFTNWTGGARLNLNRTALNVLRLENFAGAFQNFALAPAAGTIYRVVLSASNSVFSASIFTQAGALLERQSLAYTPGTPCFRSISNIAPGGGARWLEYKTEYYSAITAP